MFSLKITYPIIRLPEHLQSTIPNIHMDGGCAVIVKGRSITGNGDTKTTQTHLWGLMPEPVPRRSVEDHQVMCQSQEGHNIRPDEG